MYAKLFFFRKILLICVLLLCFPALADAPPHQCDRLGQDPLDSISLKHYAEFPGLDNAKQAVKVCRQAVADFPNEQRFKFWLGRALIDNSNITEGLEVLRSVALTGNALAQLHLGNKLYALSLDASGQQEEKYKKEGCDYIKKAAAQNLPEAEFQIDDDCNGNKQNLLKAIEGGSVAAMVSLAGNYEMGFESEINAEKTKEQAIKYYNMAANHGNSYAVSQLKDEFDVEPIFDIAQVQSLLNEAGFDVGTPDGKAGAKTRKAISEFKKEHCCVDDDDFSSLIDNLYKYIENKKFDELYSISRDILNIIDACDLTESNTFIGVSRGAVCPEAQATWKKFEKILIRAQAAQGDLWRHHGIYGTCKYMELGNEPSLKSSDSFGIEKLIRTTGKSTSWLYWTEGKILYSASVLHAKKFNRWRILQAERGNFSKYGRVILYNADDMDDGNSRKFGFKNGKVFLQSKGDNYSIFTRCAEMGDITKIKNLWGTVEILRTKQSISQVKN